MEYHINSFETENGTVYFKEPYLVNIEGEYTINDKVLNINCHSNSIEEVVEDFCRDLGFFYNSFVLVNEKTLTDRAIDLRNYLIRLTY
jgi:hypothetical protein